VKSKTDPRTDSKDKTLFHPFELAFCGYSNSGKTTLIEKLVEQMSKQYNIGYVKHDAHRFNIDHSGKDTDRISKSGAHQAAISDRLHSALVNAFAEDFVLNKSKMQVSDFVFIEGYKESDTAKIILVDPDRIILRDIEQGLVTRPICYIGEAASLSQLPTSAPYFQRDDVVGVKSHIEKYFFRQVASRPLNGLVLAGGHSTRMKSNKALLEYQKGRPQALVAMDQLQSFCESVYLSARKDQPGLEPINRVGAQKWSEVKQIHDSFLDIGPLGGILSAMKSQPKAAWIVLACDLPFVTDRTLKKLINGRNPFKFATCFKSIYNDFPEPLCAIYEPKSYLRMLEFLGLNYQCPRKILINSDIQLLEPESPLSLENINFPNEYLDAKSQIAGSL